MTNTNSDNELVPELTSSPQSSSSSRQQNPSSTTLNTPETINLETTANKQNIEESEATNDPHDDFRSCSNIVENKTNVKKPIASNSSIDGGHNKQDEDFKNKSNLASRDNRLAITAGSSSDDNVDSSYHLKWIPWNTGRIPIVMQSKNGPCPLIATMNVLLLREKVKLPDVLEQITENQLFTYLGECLVDSIPTTTTDVTTISTTANNPSQQQTTNEDDPNRLDNEQNILLNIEQNIHDAIDILPKLRTGLDVNIRFTGITDFEYTPECIIFDLLGIPLYHGWLSDPSLLELQNAIGNQSYNQLVDHIITNKNSDDPAMQAKVLIAEEFLDATASQLTQHGLNELKTSIKDNEIGILFRNNHFLTMFKRESEIYTLVTDHGYLTEENIIWETLDNVEGVGRFFDANFQISNTNSTKQAGVFEEETKRQKQLEMDYLLALSLREDDRSPTIEQTSNVDNQPTTTTTTTITSSSAIAPINQTSILESTTTDEVLKSEYDKMADLQKAITDLNLKEDYELAKALQEEEDRIGQEGNNQGANRPSSSIIDPYPPSVDRAQEIDETMSNTTANQTSSYTRRNPSTSGGEHDQEYQLRQQQHSQYRQSSTSTSSHQAPSGSMSNNPQPANIRRQRNDKNTKNPNCSVM